MSDHILALITACILIAGPLGSALSLIPWKPVQLVAHTLAAIGAFDTGKVRAVWTTGLQVYRDFATRGVDKSVKSALPKLLVLLTILLTGGCSYFIPPPPSVPVELCRTEADAAMQARVSAECSDLPAPGDFKSCPSYRSILDAHNAALRACK